MTENESIRRGYLKERAQITIAAALVALLSWSLLVLVTGDLNRPDPRCSAQGCSARFLIAHNPYCLIDPTCASPLLRTGYTSGHHFAAYWQGMAWLANFGDPTWDVGPDNPIQTFSVLNFVLFVLVYAVLIILAARQANRRRQDAIVSFSSIWYILEVLRWFFIYSQFVDKNGSATFHSGLTYVVALSVLGPLVVGVAWYIFRLKHSC
jgi:hypothetical protein